MVQSGVLEGHKVSNTRSEQLRISPETEKKEFNLKKKHFMAHNALGVGDCFSVSIYSTEFNYQIELGIRVDIGGLIQTGYNQVSLKVTRSATPKVNSSEFRQRQKK